MDTNLSWTRKEMYALYAREGPTYIRKHIPTKAKMLNRKFHKFANIDTRDIEHLLRYMGKSDHDTMSNLLNIFIRSAQKCLGDTRIIEDKIFNAPNYVNHQSIVSDMITNNLVITLYIVLFYCIIHGIISLYCSWYISSCCSLHISWHISLCISFYISWYIS